jgi:hypothetical protein
LYNFIFFWNSKYATLHVYVHWLRESLHMFLHTTRKFSSPLIPTCILCICQEYDYYEQTFLLGNVLSEKILYMYLLMLFPLVYY